MDIAYPGSLSLKHLLENPTLLQNPGLVEGELKKGDKLISHTAKPTSAALLNPNNIWQGEKSGIEISASEFMDLDEFFVQSEIQESIVETKETKMNGNISVVPTGSDRDRATAVNVELDVDDNDLALASVPGQEGFDPASHSFSVDELKPMPLIRKSRKIYTPDELKDNKYWQRRKKNNVAAKRSREARRIKENQITLRAAFLEKENSELRKALKDSERMRSQMNVRLAELEKKLASLSVPKVKLEAPSPPQCLSPVSNAPDTPEVPGKSVDLDLLFNPETQLIEADEIDNLLGYF